MFLHVSNPRVRLQEDGCTYRCVIVCFTCIRMNSLVGRRLHVVGLYCVMIDSNVGSLRCSIFALFEL
jgi:hypothetical protein